MIIIVEPGLMQIFKLSQGEFVVPDKVEAAYKNLELISQIYVYGEPTRSRLLAVVVCPPSFRITISSHVSAHTHRAAWATYLPWFA